MGESINRGTDRLENPLHKNKLHLWVSKEAVGEKKKLRKRRKRDEELSVAGKCHGCCLGNVAGFFSATFTLVFFLCAVLCIVCRPCKDTTL